MSINRKFFFQFASLNLFDGKFTQSQVNGISLILDAWEATMSQQDDRWLAYMLGTAHHETGRTMQPVRETFASSDAAAAAILNKAYKAGRLPWVKSAYWTPDEQGRSWLGRGLVQLTHKANYEAMTNRIGVDLVTNPTAAMKPDVAVKIMIVGMTTGAFTGKKLGDFFSSGRADWRNARKIINGIERADLVASYAMKYYAAISYTT